MKDEDKVIFTFPVLWQGWECDSIGWIMERPDSTRYIRLTNHGGEYEAKPEKLCDKIAEYQTAISATREALLLLN